MRQDTPSTFLPCAKVSRDDGDVERRREMHGLGLVPRLALLRLRYGWQSPGAQQLGLATVQWLVSWQLF